jgi:hypothetical protein
MVGRSLSALQRDRRASLAGAGPAAPHLWHHHTQGLAPRVDGAHHQGPRRHSELRRRRGPSLLLRPCRRSQLDRAVAPLHLLRRGRAHLRSNITTPDPTSAHLPYSPLRLYWQVGSMTPSAASHAALDFAPQPAPQPIRRASSSSSSLLRRASNTGMAGLGGMDPADDRTSPSPLVPASAHHPCFHHLPTTPASIIGSPSLLYSIPSSHIPAPSIPLSGQEPRPSYAVDPPSPRASPRASPTPTLTPPSKRAPAPRPPHRPCHDPHDAPRPPAHQPPTSSKVDHHPPLPPPALLPKGPPVCWAHRRRADSPGLSGGQCRA